MMQYALSLGSESEPEPVDLTGYSLRMDIVTPSGEWRYTFNSDEIADLDPTEPGSQPDAVTEATLGPDGSIEIVVSRALTLPGGELYEDITNNQLTFNYDIFLRNTGGKQKKVLKGTINVEKSYTLWL